MTLLEKIADQSDFSLAPEGYRLGEVLGVGGMGVVYALHALQGNEMPLAVKMVHPSMLASTEAEIQLQHEALIEKKLSHLDSVVQTLEYAHHEQGHGYKIMQRMEGVTLKNWLFTNRAYLAGLNLEERLALILPMICEILGILERIHALQIVHGDIKPGNIFIETGLNLCPHNGMAGSGGMDRRPSIARNAMSTMELIHDRSPTINHKLCLFDFGLAEHLEKPNQNRNFYQAYSRFYSSPVKLKGKTGQPCDDIYSLAMTFGEIIFGRKAILDAIMPTRLPRKSALLQFFLHLMQVQQERISCDRFALMFRDFCAVESLKAGGALFPPVKFVLNQLSRQRFASFAQRPIHLDEEYGQACA